VQASERTKPLTLGEGSSPIYKRLKDVIQENIRSGRWVADEQIPSENTLVRDLGISRMTIHRALRELTQEGVLIRVHGVGTFVAGAKRQAPMMEVRSIAEEIAERGNRHSCDVILHTEEIASEEIAGHFGEPALTKVFHTILAHREDGVPVQIEDRYVNPKTLPNYLEINFNRETPHHYLMRQAPLSEGEHIIEAVLANAAERKLLDIERGEPCLRVNRRTWSNGKVVSTARLLYPGSRYQIGGRFLQGGV
jgi:GntR family histidine utilization transcriptional repressor